MLDDRFNWALKMVNANRLWLASQSLPALTVEATNESAADALAHVGI